MFSLPYSSAGGQSLLLSNFLVMFREFIMENLYYINILDKPSLVSKIISRGKNIAFLSLNSYIR